MSGTRWIGLITTASTAELGELLTEFRGSNGPLEKVYGWLGDENHSVVLTLNKRSWGEWRYLGDRTADVIWSINHEHYDVSEFERARHYLDLLLGLKQRDDVEAATFEELDEACLCYWNTNEVVFNSDPFIWNSASGQVIRTGFEAAGIEYRTERLERYFASEFYPERGE